MTDNQEKSSLRKIPNVGSQTEQDLIAMGYTSIASLKGKGSCHCNPSIGLATLL